MPSKRTTPRSALPVIKLKERRLSGADIGLPMVGFIAATMRFEAGHVGWHAHEEVEIHMMLRGATEYEFQGGQREALVGAHFLIVPPRIVHRGFRDVREPSLICAITYNPEGPCSRNGPFTKKEFDWIAQHVGTARPVVRPMSPMLRRMVHAFHQAICSHPAGPPSPDAVAAIKLQTAAILLEIARHSRVVPQNDSAGIVALATAHMEHHYVEDLQMEDVAAVANCSRSRLHAVFKRETGMSPNDWLQRWRVKKSGELLTMTNRTFVDIALSVGFSSQQYFCHVFRKYTGKTPGEYRKERND